MKFQIGAMSLGDILDRGLKIYLARLPVFYAINLIVLVPVIALQLVIPLLATGPNAAATEALGNFGVVILSFILEPLASAAMLFIVSQEFVDQPAGMGDSFQFALGRFGKLLGTSFLAGLVIGIGFVCCIAPGILFAVWYAFVAQVVVVEGLGGNPALRRSKDLTEGYRWRVFGVWVLIVIANAAITAAVLAIAAVLPGRQQVQIGNQVYIVYGYGSQVVQIVMSWLANILIQSYLAVCFTLLYFDLRIRKEGFDLELAAKQQVQPQQL